MNNHNPIIQKTFMQNKKVLGTSESWIVPGTIF